jgi:hypothetical protein
VEDRIDPGHGLAHDLAVGEVAATNIHALGLKARLWRTAEASYRIPAPEQKVDDVAADKAASPCD